MARRRKLDWAAAAEGVNRSLQPFLYDALLRRRMEQQSALVGERQQEQNAFSLIPDVLMGKTPLSTLSSDLQERMSRHIDVPAAQAAYQKNALGNIMGDVGEAQNLSALPTAESLSAKLEGAGIDLSPQYGTMRQEPAAEGSNLTEEGNLPSRASGPVIPPVQKQALEGLQSKTNQLIGEQRKQTTPVNRMSPSGATSTEYVPTTDLASLGEVQTGLSAEQEAKNKLEASQKYGELSPGFIAAKADSENMLRTLTSQSAARFAGQTAGAEAYAREAGRLSPDLIDKRVEEDLRKYHGTLRPTEGDIRSKALMGPLIAMDGEARMLENEGARLQIGSVAMASSPVLGKVGEYAPWLEANKEINKQYAQKAINYAATYTYLKSGVQSRIDEFERYIYNLFAKADDSPNMVIQKQQSRAVFQASEMANREGGPEAAARVMANGFKTGAINPEVLRFLSDDAAFQQPLLRELSTTFRIGKDSEGNTVIIGPR